MILLLLGACERDPSLLGHWEIVAIRAGGSLENLEQAERAGFMEFQESGPAFAMFSYTWNGGWTPDPTPDLVLFETSAGERDDFVETYKEKGETYSVTMTPTYGTTRTLDILAWEGSSVTLSTADGWPVGDWASTSSIALELDLER